MASRVTFGGRLGGANINMGNNFRYVPQGQVTTSHAFAKIYSADSLYGNLPAHINMYSTVQGAAVFRIKGVDEPYRGPGKEVVAFMDGIQTPARVFVQGARTLKEDPTQSKATRMARLEEATYILGFCHQGMRDKHEGSKLFAVVTDGSVTTTNTSQYPVGVGDRIFACYPSFDAPRSGTLTQGFRDGKHLLVGPKEILGHLNLSELARDCELDGNRVEWDKQLANAATLDSNMLPIEPFRYQTASAAFDALIFASWIMQTRDVTDAAAIDRLKRDLGLGGNYARREELIQRLARSANDAYDALVSSMPVDASAAEDRVRDSLSVFNGNTGIDATEAAINRVAAIKDDHYVGTAMGPAAPYEDLQLNVHLGGHH